MMKTIKGKATSPADFEGLKDAVKDLQTSVRKLEARVAQLTEARENAKQNDTQTVRRLERAEEQLRRTVTDEEFGAYTRQTTEAVNGLTERVGRAMGILDASR